MNLRELSRTLLLHQMLHERRRPSAATAIARLVALQAPEVAGEGARLLASYES